MTTFDIKKAVKLNSHYSRSTRPPWRDRFDQVITELGFMNMSPGAEAFADAVYQWQQRQSGLKADGILGPNSWGKLEPQTRYSIDLTQIPPTWLNHRPQVAEKPQQLPHHALPTSGSIPYAIGQASIVRIPVPGTNGLAIEFSPRGWQPKGGSTSTLFIQNAAGKKNLRLDYGYNVKTKSINYHWNQKGTHGNFGIPDHTPTGRAGKVAYQSAKYFRYAGRVLIVVGATVDIYSVVKANKPMRRATEVISAWALAWVGCKTVGATGAYIGSIKPGLGTAIGGIGGCIIGGVGGYWGGEKIGGEVYDWAEDTIFIPLPEVRTP